MGSGVGALIGDVQGRHNGRSSGRMVRLVGITSMQCPKVLLSSITQQLQQPTNHPFDLPVNHGATIDMNIIVGDHIKITGGKHQRKFESFTLKMAYIRIDFKARSKLIHQ